MLENSKSELPPAEGDQPDYHHGHPWAGARRNASQQDKLDWEARMKQLNPQWQPSSNSLGEYD